ncbi:right-handed parallel beta-helix repeat-containing protein, partial [Klebsiella pneumoniae]|nr:right-handed parallel beta-helix repeat-containing protein [Klebsiella pneumoniae]
DNLLFTGFTIDGENQTLNPASGYLPEIKAIFIQYWSNSIIDDMEIVNIGATGLGVDMHYNCLITRCIVENCGRLAEQGALGASGIGIGTG